MSDRQERSQLRRSLTQQTVAAATRRLEGRWDDPVAWRVLCEEIVAAWQGCTDVGWAVLCPREVLRTAASEEDIDGRAVVWTAATGGVAWHRSPRAAQLWSLLDGSSSDLVGDNGDPPFNFPAVDGFSGTSGWLARGIGWGGQSVLALVLGLSREIGPRPGGDPLANDLQELAGALAPLMGQRRRLFDLSTEVFKTRSECETLSRLSELRSRLATVTAHELKTPLTSITAYAEVLEKQIDDPTFTYGPEFLRIIRGESDRLLRLVDRLLDSSRRGRGPVLDDPHAVAVGPIVDDVIQTMAPQASNRELSLVCRVPDDIPRIAGDDDLIRQVLVNLLSNAFKFTPPGGRVVVSAREDSAMIRLAVSDNGPGIQPDDLRTIFQSFYRTRSARSTDGVGLGLSIVQEITNLHGGNLDVTSRLGRGTTFGVLLPKQQQHTAIESVVTDHGLDLQQQQDLCGLSMRLVAELATARGVALLLPDRDGDNLSCVATMGLGTKALRLRARPGDDLDAAAARGPALVGLPVELQESSASSLPEHGEAMVTSFRLGDQCLHGLVLATRRLGGGVFDDDDLGLLRVLAEILGNAWSAVLAPGTDRRVFENVTEAVAALGGLRRGGVPTADPLALRMLTRTGRRLGQTSFEVRLLQYAGALHDAGMMLLDADVIHKPEILDLDERDYVGRHPQRALDLLGPLVDVPDLQAIIRYHHERVDGRGYPEGRRGSAIPLGARILAVVDAFFAMVHSRPWREGLPVAVAAQELEANVGTQFDGEVVEAFLSVLQEEGLVADTVAEGPVESGPGR